MIRDLLPGDVAACDVIVAGLPDWFGNADGLRECAEAVRTQTGLVAEKDGGTIGFLTFATVGLWEVEITWMAVDSAARGLGTGSALIAELLVRLKKVGATRLLVKTLSDREDPGPAYTQTRAFYLAKGFAPEAELDIWGPDNPAQIMVKIL